MKSGLGILTVALAVVSPTFEARAGEVPREPGLRGGGPLLVDHQPHPVGGLGSDTSFRDDFGTPFWQRVADDILLTQPPPGPVTHIVWWGFYGGTFDKVPEPPPASETMRIRFYEPRPSDGLPGNVLFEETLLDPLRTATGRHIGLGPLPPEYIFEADLTTPFQLDANVPYWLEIVQLGDLNSNLRWEFSLAELNGFGVANPFFSDWHLSTLEGDKAFQLWTVPEPTSVVLFAFGMCFFGRRGEKGTSLISRLLQRLSGLAGIIEVEGQAEAMQQSVMSPFLLQRLSGLAGIIEGGRSSRGNATISDVPFSPRRGGLRPVVPAVRRQAGRTRSAVGESVALSVRAGLG